VLGIDGLVASLFPRFGIVGIEVRFTPDPGLLGIKATIAPVRGILSEMESSIPPLNGGLDDEFRVPPGSREIGGIGLFTKCLAPFSCGVGVKTKITPGLGLLNFNHGYLGFFSCLCCHFSF